LYMFAYQSEKAGEHFSGTCQIALPHAALAIPMKYKQK